MLIIVLKKKTLPFHPSGFFTIKEEKPKFYVIPICWLWGFLSKAAVDAFVLNIYYLIFFFKLTKILKYLK